MSKAHCYRYSCKQEHDDLSESISPKFGPLTKQLRTSLNPLLKLQTTKMTLRINISWRHLYVLFGWYPY